VRVGYEPSGSARNLKAGGLPERKRQELASAIRTAARVLGRSPEISPADGRLLASRLKEVAPAAIGISRGRWNNVRALLRTALALVQPISPGRHRNDLLLEWVALSKAPARDCSAMSRPRALSQRLAISIQSVRLMTWECGSDARERKHRVNRGTGPLCIVYCFAIVPSTTLMLIIAHPALGVLGDTPPHEPRFSPSPSFGSPTGEPPVIRALAHDEQGAGEDELHPCGAGVDRGIHWPRDVDVNSVARG
jgi:hypothetical protein